VVAVPRVTQGTGMHAYRADCASCGAYIKFLSQYSPEERDRRRQEAAQKRQPATPAQVHYLTALGDTDPLPANKWDAHTRIDQLRKKKGVAS
jgi:hypothetical protein